MKNESLSDLRLCCRGEMFLINAALSRGSAVIPGRNRCGAYSRTICILLLLLLLLLSLLLLVLFSNAFLVKRPLRPSASSRFNLTSQPDFCKKGFLKGKCKIYLRTLTTTILIIIRARSVAGFRTWKVHTKVLVILLSTGWQPLLLTTFQYAIEFTC